MERRMKSYLCLRMQTEESLMQVFPKICDFEEHAAACLLGGR